MGQCDLALLGQTIGQDAEERLANGRGAEFKSFEPLAALKHLLDEGRQLLFAADKNPTATGLERDKHLCGRRFRRFVDDAQVERDGAGSWHPG